MGVTRLVNLQRSKYANLYYLNVGLFFHELNPEERVNLLSCHLRCRVDSLFRESVNDEDFVFWLNGEVRVENRWRKVERLVLGLLIPWFEEHSSLDKVSDLVEKDGFLECFVRQELSDLARLRCHE